MEKSSKNAKIAQYFASDIEKKKLSFAHKAEFESF